MTAHVDYLGLGARLASAPSGALAEAAFADELRGAPILHPLMTLVDQAHVIALTRAGVIDDRVASPLFDALARLGRVPAHDLTWDPSVGDIYNNRDAWLRHELGDVAGWLSTGRARRESTTGAFTIAVRQRLIELHRAVRSLFVTTLEVAGRHRHSLMPDFTYLQHAHPTTLGHYLTSLCAPFERDLGRIEHALGGFDASPLGGGSTNGTRFGLDRELLADLLCFATVRPHTRDAMWATDLPVEAAAALAALAATTGRMADELLLWATAEFGYVELADRHCRTSVIMPQKKNPYGLSHIRGVCREMIALVTSTATTQMTTTGHPDNRIHSYNELPGAIDRMVVAIDLCREIIDEMTFDTDRMQAAAAQGFTAATELCDIITLTRGLPNRTAHRLVGAAVRLAGERGEALSPASISAAAAALEMDDPSLDAETFDVELDPSAIIEARRGSGGAHPEAVASLIATMRRSIDAAADRVDALACSRFPDLAVERVAAHMDHHGSTS